MRYRVADMVAAAHRFGLTVEVVPGAELRGDAVFNPAVFVGHHTAGPSTGVRPSLSVCVNGRTGLAGPLCNWFLDRNGVCVIVATGRANHAGAGGFRGVSGNSGAQGCEAESVGDGTDWSPVMLWAYPRVVAAGLWLMGRDASWYCSHRTWAPDRKIDPAGISDDWMRHQVNAVFDGTAGNPPEEEDVSQIDSFSASALAQVQQAVNNGVQQAMTAQPLEYYAGAAATGKPNTVVQFDADLTAHAEIVRAVRDVQLAIADLTAVLTADGPVPPTT